MTPLVKLTKKEILTQMVVEKNDEFLRLREGNNTWDYHYFWLRHNCPCCFHSQTNERTLCSSEFSLEIKPDSITLNKNEQTLTLNWLENNRSHVSQFSLKWLLEQSYAKNRQSVSPPSNDVSAIELDCQYLDSTTLLKLAMPVVQKRGVVIVRNYGKDSEELINQLQTIDKTLIPSHFGRYEDLRTDNTTNKNTDQLGYTNSAVNLHTDMPFIEKTPRFQLLQGMKAADKGGESIIASSKQAALYLKSLDQEAFYYLSTIPIKFHRKQKNFESVFVSPLIKVIDNSIQQIRFSYFTMAPHQHPFNIMKNWYRAYNQFTNIVRNPKYHYDFLLQEGDFVIYDNHTMLHARKSFSGNRWVRGIYFE